MKASWRCFGHRTWCPEQVTVNCLGEDVGEETVEGVDMVSRVVGVVLVGDVESTVSASLSM